MLGLRANLAQFSLLVAVNALVGGMLGQERTVLPLLAERVFALEAYTAALTYILAFGIFKAATNYFAGTWSDRFGRKPVILAGLLLFALGSGVAAWAPIDARHRGTSQIRSFSFMVVSSGRVVTPGDRARRFRKNSRHKPCHRASRQCAPGMPG